MLQHFSIIINDVIINPVKNNCCSFKLSVYQSILKIFINVTLHSCFQPWNNNKNVS